MFTDRFHTLFRGGLALVLGLASAQATQAAPFRYGEDRAPGIVQPIYATTMSEARINELVFQGLFSDDRELRSTPQLAASYTLAEDSLSMTVTLKPDVKWHDGHGFSAEDVVFSIAAYTASQTASPERGRVAWIRSATSPAPLTVQLTFHQVEYSPQDKLHFKILPAHLFSEAELTRNHPFRSRPIGTGPFQLTGFNRDNSITLQRFEGYYGDPPQLAEIIMREVSDPNYQSKLLIYQSLEALVRVLPKDIATLEHSRDISLYPYQTNSWWYVGFNLKQERFKSAALRKAVHHYLDIESLLAPIGTGEIISGPYVKSSPYYNHAVHGVLYNPKQGDVLLGKLGYAKEGRFWVKDGQTLTLRIATLKNLATAQEVLINMQSQLMAHGILLEPVFLGRPDWKQRIWRERDFDMILSQWSFDRNENIYEQFHSKGRRNFTSYHNAKVDDWLETARNTADPKEKKAVLRAVHAAIHQDTPMVFLWTLDSYAALSNRVTNVSIHPFYFFTWAQGWGTR